mgnify:CR=1 FL=1
MYQKPYTEYIKENPDSEFSKFLVRFFSAKPDFTEMEREVREFEKEIAAEQEKDLRRMIAERSKPQEVVAQ